MSSKEDLLITKMEKVEDQLISINRTLVVQEENLRHHMYRTELAEKAIDRLSSELGPIKAHVNQIEGALRYLGIASVLVTIVGGLLKIFGVF